jgi:penicillin-binding protein 2
MGEFNLKEKINNRYNILAAIFLIFAVVFVYKLFDLQLVHGVEYNEQAKRNLNERKIIAPRGDIIDSNGVPVATNRKGYLVQIADTGVEDQQLNALISKTIKVLEKHKDGFDDSLKKYLTYKPIGFGPYLKYYDDKLKELKKMLGIYSYPNAATKNTVEEVYYYLRDTVYEINMDKKRYSDAEAYKIMCVRFAIRNYSTLNAAEIASDVSKETLVELDEARRDLPGVSTDYVPIRKYTDAKIAGQVIGYMGPISSESEYNILKEKGYGINDLIGKSGIEYSAEKYLKGRDGKKRIELDPEGRLVDELSTDPAIPGDDVQLTLNMRLQKVAYESLGRNIKKIHDRVGNTAVSGNRGDAVAGSVVALDVRNGDVLAMASFPSFDPSVFLAGAENKQAQRTITKILNDNKLYPMRNRTIQDGYAPGSTFKPLMGIAGLQTGSITRYSTINDPGVIYRDGVMLKCLEYNLYTKTGNHGNLNLRTALATSCNIYFQKLGMDMLGIKVIDKWAKTFGLGEKTGIDLPGEISGNRSNPEALKKRNEYYGYDEVWGPVQTAFSSIGQELSYFTPLQLANYISAIANGGKLYTPHIIKKAIKYDGTIDYEAKPKYKKLPVSQGNLNAVIDGMEAVANSSEGTAASVFQGFPYKVAGKTGTAETGDESKSNNGVFVCFAPADHPRIAVAVIIEHGVWGMLTAPVAKDILMEYFNLNNKTRNNDKLEPDRVVLSH